MRDGGKYTEGKERGKDHRWASPFSTFSMFVNVTFVCFFLNEPTNDKFPFAQ
jgi:hypothetical protein